MGADSLVMASGALGALAPDSSVIASTGADSLVMASGALAPESSVIASMAGGGLLLMEVGVGLDLVPSGVNHAECLETTCLARVTWLVKQRLHVWHCSGQSLVGRSTCSGYASKCFANPPWFEKGR